MEDQLQAFVECPTRENFLRLRDAVVAEVREPPRRDDLPRLAQLCAEGRFVEARELLQQMMPSWLLSPRTHGYAALAAEQLGDVEDAQLEHDLRRICLEGLLGTGDGTRDHPYLVLHTSDEYEILESLGREPKAQHLHEGPGGRFDVITCRHGPDVWFDVADMLPRGPLSHEVGPAAVRMRSPAGRRP
jgi:hypothetical protein